METMAGFLVVCVGAGVGGMLRHGCALVALRSFGTGFPAGTLAIDVAGSAVMGLVIGLFAARHFENEQLRLFITTGLLGGFTTFSTFSLDTLTLWQRGEHVAAASYVMASITVSLIAIAISVSNARKLGAML